MNVELIKIDRATARAKLNAYRKALATRAHTEAANKVRAEWEGIKAGYRAAARGLPLIELSKAMARGGWDEQGRPRFAVARADQRQVRCNVGGWALEFEPPWTGYRQPARAKFRFELSMLPPRAPGARTHNGIRAIVPMVPPDVLPRLDLDLSRRVILWEADWIAAPVDPLLLLPLGGDLYAVEAAWDLSPLERAVLAGRAS
jgi:hypothetical protein